MEAHFLIGNRLQNEIALADQVSIVAAHEVDHLFGDPGQEGPIKANQLAKARSAAQDHAQHIAAPFIAGQDAVTNQESDGAGVVSDGAVTVKMGQTVGFILAEQFANPLHNRQEGIGVVVVLFAL